MKLLYIFPLIILVSACDSIPKPTLIREVPVVYEPDASLYYCPTLKSVPDPTMLTDGQVAELLLVLDENNRVCARSLEEIRLQIASAKELLEAE